ncbi:hippurate hydrolase [Bosea lathyri]|uniref:Hippurate hydrolase n=2 Tax=Bosea lathyri TaxID=1036778 RepID=A0A1H6CAE1_9HYPH|nr:hippurate hydrolase [Bosea lathyri]
MSNDSKLDYLELEREMTTWRHELHANPEFGFEEHRTAAFVASKLREFGLDEVAEGIGGTGVVGTLKRGTGNRAVALRADMDALRILEDTNLSYQSKKPGLMHACGHDGHTTMLLGAAKLLAAEGGFDGTVRFVFQPAEEWGKGALAMLADGLMERFPFDEIYGLHNAAGMPVGQLQAGIGAVTSAEDNFEITLKGVGGHSSRPQSGREVMVAVGSLICSLQTIVSRRLRPNETAVVSITEVITDGTRNVLPGQARILGDVRSFVPEVSLEIEKHMLEIAKGTAQTYGLSAELSYLREFVPVVNDAALVDEMLAAAGSVLGTDKVQLSTVPGTGSEDFARFLEHVPGVFARIGNGDSASAHNPKFDFDDGGLLHGANVHAAITRRRLAAQL